MDFSVGFDYDFNGSLARINVSTDGDTNEMSLYTEGLSLSGPVDQFIAHLDELANIANALRNVAMQLNETKTTMDGFYPVYSEDE